MRDGGPGAQQNNPKVWDCRDMEDGVWIPQMVAHGTTTVSGDILLSPHTFISINCQY